jgi:hypothetical protein
LNFNLPGDTAMSRDQDPSIDESPERIAMRRRRLLQGAAALPMMGLGGLALRSQPLRSTRPSWQ